jgi:hypothetical protein
VFLIVVGTNIIPCVWTSSGFAEKALLLAMHTALTIRCRPDADWRTIGKKFKPEERYTTSYRYYNYYYYVVLPSVLLALLLLVLYYYFGVLLIIDAPVPK